MKSLWSRDRAGGAGPATLSRSPALPVRVLELLAVVGAADDGAQSVYDDVQQLLPSGVCSSRVIQHLKVFHNRKRYIVHHHHAPQVTRSQL